MFTLKVENIKGEIIELTNNEENYQVTKVTGLNPPNAEINSSNYANGDGFSFNNSRIPNRQIVITLYINGDIESNRQKLYRYFRCKEWCKIYYQNERRNIFTEGYVQSFEVSEFTKKQVAQIAIICPDPYLKDIKNKKQSISKVIHNFTFPFFIDEDEPKEFSIYNPEGVSNVINESEVETRIIIIIDFIGNINKLEIRNVDTGEKFIINYEFIKNDRLIINCNKGKKSVKMIRDAVEYNLISNVQKNLTWFKLGIGDNNFSFIADDGKNDMIVDIDFLYYKVYLGV